MQYLSTISIMTEWSQFISKANHSTLHPSLCSNHQCHRRWSWPVLWRPTRPSKTNIKKRCYFDHRGLECKNRKSRDTWSNRQVLPWNTNWSRTKVNRVLPREHAGHSKTLFQQHKRWLHIDITYRSILKLDCLYSLHTKMEKLYTLSTNKTWSWLWIRLSAPYWKLQA